MGAAARRGRLTDTENVNIYVCDKMRPSPDGSSWACRTRRAPQAGSRRRTKQKFLTSGQWTVVSGQWSVVRRIPKQFRERGNGKRLVSFNFNFQLSIFNFLCAEGAIHDVVNSWNGVSIHVAKWQFIKSKVCRFSRLAWFYRFPSSTKRPKVGVKPVSLRKTNEITAWWNPLRRIKRIWFHFLRSGRFHYKTLVLWFHRAEGVISL